ncbi:MAG TPA: SCO1664 family protein [Acidimicrobiales bacterium]|nr:SCO1664 family protein [Acidimicrobiales bacterium]
MPEEQRPPTAQALTTLARGEVELSGRLPWSSNGTFLAELCLDGVAMKAVYKPLRGERPLWDFPDGLYRREVAAYELSAALGWDLVPETVAREDGPYGAGSYQRFVAADFTEHYFTLFEQPARHDALRAIAVFDLVANNADRKSGHCLLGDDGRIWGIDHGLCFAVPPKLRTVMWDFAGEAIADSLLADLSRFATDAAPEALLDLLHVDEVEAVRARAAAVVRGGHFPNPDPDRRPYPWPMV